MQTSPDPIATRRPWFLPLACGLAALFAAPARAVEYSFHKVVDSTGVFQSFPRPPTLNNRGVVVFYAVLDDDTQGVFAEDPEAGLMTIADTAGGYDWSFVTGFPSINDDDTIAFAATTAAPPYLAIYVSQAFGPLSTYQAVSSDPGAIGGVQDPWIGDSGTIVYRAGVNPPPDPYGEAAVFRGTERVVGGPTASTSFQWPDINASDDVAVVGSDGLYLNSDNVYVHSGSSASINDAGTIAFLSNAYGPLGIYTGDGISVPQLYAAATGGTSMGHPDINDAGLVAYLDRSGAYGQIFVGTAHEPLLASNSLFGGSFTQIDFFRGLNDVGEIAFSYTLSNGETGIGLATPVPEPGALFLGCSVLGALAALASRKRPAGRRRPCLSSELIASVPWPKAAESSCVTPRVAMVEAGHATEADHPCARGRPGFGGAPIG